MKKTEFFALLLAVFLVLASSCIQEKREEKTIDGKNSESGEFLSGEPAGESPANFAKIDYSIYAGGMLVDTSYEPLAREIENKDFLRVLHPFGFEPLAFITDSPFIDARINEAVKEMKAGEVRNLSIPAETSLFGPYRKELVRTMPRAVFMPRIQKMSRVQYFLSYGKEARLNETIAMDYWNATIVGIDNESVAILHLPANNSVVEGSVGSITITLNDSTIIMVFTPKLNKAGVTATGEIVTITHYNETAITADFNHPFAGKDLIFEIKLVEKGSIELWSRNIEDAVNADIAAVFFYNFSCEECAGFEEAVSSPEVLVLKERVKFAKINGDVEKELAKKYNITSYPTFLIFERGEEIKRIETFMGRTELRRALEQIFKSQMQ